MKKTIWILMLLVVPLFQLMAQSLNENEIVGTWSVKQINVLTRLPDEQKKSIEILRAAFVRSKFIFNADSTFVFDFELDKMRIPNGHWKFNDRNKSFIIQEWKDRDTNNWKLMEIVPKKEGVEIIFQLHDIYVDLIMNKDY